MGSKEANPSSNNLRTKEAIKWVLYTYSNLYAFPFNQNISFHPQSIGNSFLNVCWFAQIYWDHQQLPLLLTLRIGEFVTMLVDFIVKVCCSCPCRYFYHVLLFHGAIDQPPNLVEIWHDPKVDYIMQIGRTYSRIGLLFIFFNVVGTLIV